MELGTSDASMTQNFSWLHLHHNINHSWPDISQVLKTCIDMNPILMKSTEAYKFYDAYTARFRDYCLNTFEVMKV